MLPRAQIAPSPHRAMPALALAALIAGASSSPAAAEGAHYDGFATVSPFAVFDMSSDGHGPSGKGIVEIGIGSAVSHRLGAHFDLGLGLHYNYGRGPSDSYHEVALPALAALVIPSGDAREVRVGVGLGPALGFSPDSGGGGFFMFGGSSEFAVDFAQRFARDGLGLRVQIGVLFNVLPENTAEPDSYQARQSLLNIQLPFIRVGATWR